MAHLTCTLYCAPTLAAISSTCGQIRMRTCCSSLSFLFSPWELVRFYRAARGDVLPAHFDFKLFDYCFNFCQMAHPPFWQPNECVETSEACISIYQEDTILLYCIAYSHPLSIFFFDNVYDNFAKTGCFWITCLDSALLQAILSSLAFACGRFPDGASRVVGGPLGEGVSY